MREHEQGLSFVEHLRIEHAHLNRLLHRLHEQFASASGPRLPHDKIAEWKETLTLFSVELKRHFAAEESGGCLEEATSHLAALGRETDELERAHPRLLANLAQLEAQVNGYANGQISGAVLLPAFELFARELAQHEAGERHVVEQGLSCNMDDVGAK